jgi:hypothetical protein
LTRSLDVTRAFRDYWEEEFDAALSDHYVEDFKPAEERFGAILVFDRENMADLHVEPYVDEDGRATNRKNVFSAMSTSYAPGFRPSLSMKTNTAGSDKWSIPLFAKPTATRTRCSQS